jgi:hypothetical protein
MSIQTNSTINTYQYHQQYIPLHTNFKNQYIPIQQTIHTNTYQYLPNNTYQYMPIQTDSTINTYQYHQQYIPLHTNFNNQYIPIQQTIHTNTYQIIHTNTCQYRLILQSIHTNTDSNTYQYIPVNTYQYGRTIFNTCQYVHPPPPPPHPC